MTAREALVDFSSMATSPDDWSSLTYLLPAGAGNGK